MGLEGIECMFFFGTPFAVGQVTTYVLGCHHTSIHAAGTRPCLCDIKHLPQFNASTVKNTDGKVLGAYIKASEHIAREGYYLRCLCLNEKIE